MSTHPMTFLDSLGVGFAAAFLLLTAMGVFQYLRVRDLAEIGRDDAMAVRRVRDPGDAARWWSDLGVHKSHLRAAATRANLITASIPTLALLGTVVGFFFALLQTGQLDLGADPQATLMALMDGGVSTALATTVAGQGIYFLLGQVWAIAVAGPFEEASTLLDESLALMRDRMNAAPMAPLDAPLPPVLDMPLGSTLAPEV